jgi:hypothetical protein
MRSGTGEVALFSSVEAALRNEVGLSARLRGLPSSARFLIAAAWGAALVTLTTVLTPRSAHGPMPVTQIVLALGVFAVLLALVVRLGLRPLQARPARGAVALACFLAGLFAPALFAVLPNGGTLVRSVPGVTDLAAGVWCFVIGSVVGILLVVGMRILDRGAHRSVVHALFAATAGGLLGNASLELHCPITEPIHLLLGHATVGLALVTGYAIWVNVRAARAR